MISDPFTPRAGVPQGSVLAPLLFILYLNDRPKPIRGREVKMNETLNLFYADDNNIAISGPPNHLIKWSKNEVQRMSDWEAKWRIKINSGKSRIMIFGRKRGALQRRLENDHQFTINPLYPGRGGSTIPVTKTHTILGIKFDNNLNFVPCIKQLKAVVNITRQRFLKFIGLNNRIREFLYKCYILPKILHFYPIDVFLNRKQRLVLQSIQNRCIYHFIYIYAEIGHKRAADAHVLTRLEALNQLMFKKNQKFYKNLKDRLPKWHNIMVEWHIPSTRVINRREITPMDWSTNAMRHPLYCQYSYQ